MIRPHVIAVGQSEVFIKSVLQWKELFVVPQMPFSETGRGIILLLTEFAQCDFVRVDSDRCRWPKCAFNADANVVTAGEKTCARC